MYGRVYDWIYVTMSIMSALILLPGESWWSPLDLSFSPLTSRPATPSRESGCMNVEAVQPAAPLAFIALRIHTALTAPCPRKYSCVVAVNVFNFFCFPPLTCISLQQQPLYLLLMSFCWLFSCFRLSVEAVFWAHWERGIMFTLVALLKA